MAIKRFHLLEQRLSRAPEIREEYTKLMHEYKMLGHMEEVKSSHGVNPNTSCTYIPHHFVTKASSTTMKLRVVFDASAKFTSGSSLNDALMVGLTIQKTLVSILTRFCTYHVAFTADVAKI